MWIAPLPNTSHAAAQSMFGSSMASTAFEFLYPLKNDMMGGLYAIFATVSHQYCTKAPSSCKSLAKARIIQMPRVVQNLLILVLLQYFPGKREYPGSENGKKKCH
jgi:hypothetical protein